MSIVHVKGGKGGGVQTDRSPFWGLKVPEEIKKMVKPLKLIDKQIVRQILEAIVMLMEGKAVDPSFLEKLKTETISEEVLAVLYAGLHKLLQTALRQSKASLKKEHLKEDMMELRIPEEHIPDIVSVICGSRRDEIDRTILENRPRLAKLQNLKWRVDVAISTSVLNRALEPCVMMEMVLSDGSVKHFEVPISKFHQLRYNVALVLRQMEDLEKRGILKIQD